jgi:NAD(P)-dependent dehydrogenase (short-subunit alcohol dehydrogenase family)
MSDNAVRAATFWPVHSLSVLIPTWNQEASLEATIQRLTQALSVTVEDFELIVGDDGSTDRTAEIVGRLASKQPRIRSFRNSRPMGLGYCYTRGVEVATKSYFVYVPGDNTWPQRSFLELFGQLGKADVITSYSTNPGVMPFMRGLFSRTYTRLLNLLFGLRMRYYNGLTVYPITFLRSTPITSYGFGFQAEILLKAVDQGLSFVEVAIPMDESTVGAARVITLSNTLSAAKTTLRLYGDLRWRRRASVGAEYGEDCPVDSPPEPLTIILTGASSGIGAALSRALAADGHRLFLCARRANLLEEVAGGCQNVAWRVCDVSNEEHVREFVDWVKQRAPHVDAVINCAGSFGAIGSVQATDSREWLSVVTGNLFGTYLMSKYTLPLLAGSRVPRVINFAGGGAFSPFKNYSAYASSKAAIVRLTECLAAELAEDGIAVNAVAPGFVATEFHEATLAAGPEKAGDLHYERTKAILEGRGVPMSVPVDCVRFLLSDAALGLTGKTLSANFDPWESAAFRRRLRDITRSELYTMRRVNVVNLPQGLLRTALGEASARQENR